MKAQEDQRYPSWQSEMVRQLASYGVWGMTRACGEVRNGTIMAMKQERMLKEWYVFWWIGDWRYLLEAHSRLGIKNGLTVISTSLRSLRTWLGRRSGSERTAPWKCSLNLLGTVSSDQWRMIRLMIRSRTLRRYAYCCTYTRIVSFDPSLVLMRWSCANPGWLSWKSTSPFTTTAQIIP